MYEKKVQTGMMNNSTNINKTKNHLTHKLIKHRTHMTMDIQVRS